MVEYLFVDGGYFREMLTNPSKTFFRDRPLQIDYTAMGRTFLKCFYYDCVGPQLKGESATDCAERVERERQEFHRIRMLSGWHVVEGTVKKIGGRATQKQIDVAIAVDMLSHAHRRNMDSLTFITGDIDFKPLVEALVRDGMDVHVWYEPCSGSQDLLEMQ